MLLLGFSVVRSETEQVLGMSSFAFGMLLIAAGVFAYFLNHALETAGMDSGCRREAGSGRLSKVGHGFTRMHESGLNP
jgi:hypothetical protein